MRAVGEGMAAELPKLVIIQGPTASGKSEAAVRLAEAVGGEIVNADSLQVYRGLDIGSAKPGPDLLSRIPHHLLDIVDPDQEFTAADFRQEAAAAIAAIHARGRQPIVVGGTGLYIRTLLGGLAPSPGGDPAIRRELQAIADRQGSEELHRLLAREDPAAAARLHPRDQVRIVRALEVVRATGRSLISFQAEHGFRQRDYHSLKLGLEVPRAELYRRIDARVEAMLAVGLVEEVRGLLERGYGPELKPLGAIGYKEVCAHLAGQFSREEALCRIQQATRNYAKRQLTWLRADPEIIWVAYPETFASMCTIVMEFLCKGGNHAENALQHPGPVSQPVPQGADPGGGPTDER